MAYNLQIGNLVSFSSRHNSPQCPIRQM